MLALRKVLKVQNNEVHFELPSKYNNCKVEVLVYDIEPGASEGKVPKGIKFGGTLPYIQGEDINNEVRNLRSEWDMPASYTSRL
jgi:hypothetical protein